MFAADRGKYESLATDDAVDDSGSRTSISKADMQSTPLSFSDKLEIAKPLALPFMLPLFGVYLAEYSINQGVSPNLLYPVPRPDEHRILSHLIKRLSDFYPLWQLVYQVRLHFSLDHLELSTDYVTLEDLCILGSLVHCALQSAAAQERTHFRAYVSSTSSPTMMNQRHGN